MRIFSVFRESGRTMKRKLFIYMLALAAILVGILILSLFLFGRFSSTRQTLYDTLALQMAVFEKNMTSSWENLAFMGITLSEETSALLEEYLSGKN